MANTMKALQTVTVGAGGVLNVSFTNIPQTYTDLIIKISARRSSAGIGGPLVIYFNDDQSNVYSNLRLLGTGSAVSSNANTPLTLGLVGEGVADGATANTFSNADIYIPNYASNTLQKAYGSDMVGENNATETYITLIPGNWGNTNPITKITIESGNSLATIMQNSTFTLYGVFNADVSTAPSTPTIGTATDSATSGQVSVAFTPVSNAASYAVTSSPGGIVATGTTTPITVSGLTNGTAYTFTCVASNPFGLSVASAASNSVTPTAQFNSIATVSYPSGTGGDVVFTNIPSIYRTLQIRMFSRHTRVDNSSTWFITFNEDNGTTYSYQGAEQTGSGSISGVDQINQTRIQGPTSAANTGASRFGSAVINIFDANQTNKFKTMSYQSGFSNNNNGGARLWTAAATWRSTSAITTIRIAPNSGFAQFSHIALYGIG
jgi:hypothetical protein